LHCAGDTHTTSPRRHSRLLAFEPCPCWSADCFAKGAPVKKTRAAWVLALNAKPQAARNRPKVLRELLLFRVALIHGFHGLHEQRRQVIHRAGADARVVVDAVLADGVTVVFQVRRHPVAPDLVDRVDDLRQVQFDAAGLTQGGTRRPAWGSLDAMAAHLFADFRQVLVQFRFADHGPTPSIEWDRQMRGCQKELSRLPATSFSDSTTQHIRNGYDPTRGASVTSTLLFLWMNT